MAPNEEWGLIDKVAIVTGGGAADDGIGNGRAAAILLARAGAKVLVVDRDLTLADRTVAMIAAEGGHAVAASYDVTSSVQCAAMIEDAVSRWGRLDCLDNNVGIGSQGTVVEESEENWARVMHVGGMNWKRSSRRCASCRKYSRRIAATAHWSQRVTWNSMVMPQWSRDCSAAKT